jgi:phage terminase large subunit-like protein
LEQWDRNAVKLDEAALAGRAVGLGGIDLGNVSDLTALAWLFPDTDRGGYDVLARFWTSEASLELLDKRTYRNASGWVEDGWLVLTPGDVTDYDWIATQAKRISKPSW